MGQDGSKNASKGSIDNAAFFSYQPSFLFTLSLGLQTFHQAIFKS
jgi:hypothetical protein